MVELLLDDSRCLCVATSGKNSFWGYKVGRLRNMRNLSSPVDEDARSGNYGVYIC